MEFTKRLKETYGLSDSCAGLLLENMEKVSFLKKEIIVEEGQKDDYNYFVEQGSVRGYVLREGKYNTILFTFEGDAVASNST